ncbi:hypothetical protein EV424DRAFT_628941 [Suillus variegatus]|nr:hypothetical protein EV424DRAFT_628941 [Suillus variegatus]
MTYAPTLMPSRRRPPPTSVVHYSHGHPIHIIRYLCNFTASTPISTFTSTSTCTYTSPVPQRSSHLLNNPVKHYPLCQRRVFPTPQQNNNMQPLWTRERERTRDWSEEVVQRPGPPPRLDDHASADESASPSSDSYTINCGCCRARRRNSSALLVFVKLVL